MHQSLQEPNHIVAPPKLNRDLILVNWVFKRKFFLVTGMRPLTYTSALLMMWKCKCKSLPQQHHNCLCIAHLGSNGQSCHPSLDQKYQRHRSIWSHAAHCYILTPLLFSCQPPSTSDSIFPPSITPLSQSLPLHLYCSAKVRPFTWVSLQQPEVQCYPVSWVHAKVSHVCVFADCNASLS